ncbi:MAG: calcineurin-like phosphoesterase C-terminal domain-containing protein, partial [Bacteroidales bacterium]|nr:calcineurin-like phosphoesterase C-terminal domain-containing protein [Bacteroidales bacterium]
AAFNGDASDWADRKSDNMVYFNIWAYDPSWTIKVTENGKELSWTKVSMKDPLHLVAYEAARFNNGGESSFSTGTTAHMFRVQASSATSTLEFRITDRFGNIYTHTMTRPLTMSADLREYK